MNRRSWFGGMIASVVGLLGLKWNLPAADDKPKIIGWIACSRSRSPDYCSYQPFLTSQGKECVEWAKECAEHHMTSSWIMTLHRV